MPPACFRVPIVCWSVLLLTACDPSPRRVTALFDNEIDVEVPDLGASRDHKLKFCNDVAVPVEVAIAGVSCGCVQAVEGRVALSPGEEGSLKLAVRPLTLLPQVHHVDVACAETQQSWRILLRASARTGVYVQDVPTRLRDRLLVGVPTKVGTLQVSAAEGEGVGVHAVDLGAAACGVEIVVGDLSAVRSQAGHVLYEAPLHLVGRRETPEFMWEADVSVRLGDRVESAAVMVVVEVARG